MNSDIILTAGSTDIEKMADRQTVGVGAQLTLKKLRAEGCEVGAMILYSLLAQLTLRNDGQTVVRWKQ